MIEKKEDLEDRPDEDVNDKKDNEEAGVFAISNATIFFQLLMMLSAMYMAILCTNWGKLDVFEGSSAEFYQANSTSYWLKLAAMWITITMYLFSLLAPIIFPDREF